MSESDSTLLFRALPAQLKFTSAEKRALKDFVSLLADRVAGGRAFTCVITNDNELRKLNHNFLGHDYPTDVLSFPLAATNGNLGDIAISAERAETQAREFGHSRADEMRILMLHGVLHLSGMDHESDTGEMARAERKWREEFGLPATLLSRASSLPANPMTSLCLIVAVALTCLLAFVSYVQLLYLESLRLIRREVPALEFFRDTLVDKVGLEPEHGSLAFSLVKHVSLFLLGLFYLCALLQPGVPPWQTVLEAMGLSFLAMLFSTYFVPLFLYRRTKGMWMLKALPAIKLLAKCASPLAALVKMFQSLLDLDKDSHGEAAAADSVEHIEALITAGAEEGIFEEQDRKLIHSVVAFGDKTVRDVMTPRPNIVAISVDNSLEDLRQLAIHEQYSRIPVYRNTIDNIIGFVHVRDMFELDEEDRQAKPLKDLIRPIPLVPETKPVTDLLREMQHDGSHMAIVVDEYGNTAGARHHGRSSGRDPGRDTRRARTRSRRSPGIRSGFHCARQSRSRPSAGSPGFPA